MAGGLLTCYFASLNVPDSHPGGSGSDVSGEKCQVQSKVFDRRCVGNDNCS